MYVAAAGEHGCRTGFCVDDVDCRKAGICRSDRELARVRRPDEAVFEDRVSVRRKHDLAGIPTTRAGNNQPATAPERELAAVRRRLRTPTVTEALAHFRPSTVQ